MGLMKKPVNGVLMNGVILPKKNIMKLPLQMVVMMKRLKKMQAMIKLFYS